VYLALVQFGESSPAELSNRCGIDRSRVYDSLKRLVNHGYVRQESTKSRPRYFAEDPASVFTNIQDDFRNKIEIAEKVMQPLENSYQKPELLHDSFWNIQGAAKIQQNLKSIIKNAEKRLILVITPDLFYEENRHWILGSIIRKCRSSQDGNLSVRITMPIESLEKPDTVIPELQELSDMGAKIFNFASKVMPFGLYLNEQSFLFVLPSNLEGQPVYESGIWIENATEDKLNGFSHLADWTMTLTKQTQLWVPPDPVGTLRGGDLSGTQG
jgi:sugar-specific transcriptional regulator TrmB